MEFVGNKNNKCQSRMWSPPQQREAKNNFTSLLSCKGKCHRILLAFTLAEVLITLGIIGVVAALTIPALIQKTQDAEFINKMKKEYSVISQAYQSLKTDNGDSIENAITGASGTGNALLKNTFKQKLSYIQDCDTNNGANLGVCFVAKANAKYLNGNSSSAYYFGPSGDNSTSGLILNDGSSLAFSLDSSSCTYTRGNAAYTNSCGYVLLDVNGIQSPNAWGRDIYLFFIFSNAIRPASVATVENSVATTDDCGIGTNNGFTCTSKYLISK